MLKANEEHLLEMPFEILLTQITTLPTRYLLSSEPLDFDRAMHELRVPTILLERLKKEFDDSNSQFQVTLPLKK